MTVQQETEDKILSFLENRLSSVDLQGWIASVEEDESFAIEEREDLMRLRLLLVEAGENIRPRSEAVEFAMGLLLGDSTSVMVRTAATDDNPTIWEEEPRSMTAGAA